MTPQRHRRLLADLRDACRDVLETCVDDDLAQLTSGLRAALAKIDAAISVGRKSFATRAEAFARAYAENEPDGTDPYGDPCCDRCRAPLRHVGYDGYRSVCVHDAGCEWVGLRRDLGLPVPVTFPGGERHCVLGEEDGE